MVIILPFQLEILECKKCGAPNLTAKKLADGVWLFECGSCQSKYWPKEVITITPRILIKREPKPFEFKLNQSLLIGREPEYNYVIIKTKLGNIENTYIRNPYVSRKHIIIKVGEEYRVDKSASRFERIFAVNKCLIKDSGSSNGTAINDVQLKPNEERVLKHDDQIILAPKTSMPLTIFFKET